MQRRISVVALSVVLLFSLGCRRNTATPVPVIDQVGHAINVADALLTSATGFYSEQKQACEIAAITCRFSAQGLDSYRVSLQKANTSFRQVVAVYEQWRRGESGQAQVEIELVNLNRELSTVRIECGKGCE